MKKSYYIAGMLLLALSIIVAFLVPIIQIIKYQDILNNGIAVKVRLNGFDPYDAFKGRFVAIDLNFGSYQLPEPMTQDQFFPKNEQHNKYKSKYPVNIILNKDNDGFASIKKISFNCEGSYSDNEIVMRGTQSRWQVTYEYKNAFLSNGKIVAITPATHINRFYMNEFLAPRAEQLLRDNKVRENAYAIIKIKNKIPVIENIYIDDKPISQYK
jgi:uncharacterized membrane-anchored protein